MTWLVVGTFLALMALAAFGLWFVDRMGANLLDEAAREAQYRQHKAEMAAKSLNALPPE